MLSELHIQNIAVIQKASIPFKEGLNVFTGETGAGKTILISAIDAVLGERTSRDIIRSGEEKAQVSALFENISPKTIKILEELGYEVSDDSVLIFREISVSGKNSCRINGTPANVTLLKEVSRHLLNIHGQRDTGQLLSADQHLSMIDDYGEVDGELAEYQKSYQLLLKKRSDLQALDMDENQKIQRMDMLRFQIEEIEVAELDDPKEEDDLLARKKLVAGSEKVRKSLSSAASAYLGSGETAGIDELLNLFMVEIEHASEYMEELSPLVERLDEIAYELTDMGRDVQGRLETLDVDPQELDELERRIDSIYKLKRKYGSTIEEVLKYYSDAVVELESMSLSEETKVKLTAEIEQLEEHCYGLAKKISRKRSIACKGFIEQVEGQLEFLDMPSVKLSVAHETTGLTQLGTDHLEFMIITNVGEQPKPLGKVASGGELARIMLAIKNVLADKDDIDTLIFDEIDTGVSGKAAGKIGRKLAEVSQSRQVICVTHLAQVAAFADNHLYIHKEVDGARTYTLIDEISGEDSVAELARITSGEVITESAMETTRELIRRAKES